MPNPLHRIVKKARAAGAIALALRAAKRRCRRGEADALIAGIVDFEHKDHGVELGEWRYEHVVSEKSGAPYYYYHLPAEREGAPSLVMIHGMFLDARNFIRFVPLARHFELIAVELPHQSPFYNGRIADFTDLLQDFLDTLGLARIHLCGISLGGMIAMAYAGGSPRTPIDRLYLISTDAAKDMAALEKQRRNVGRAIKAVQDREDLTICLVDELRRRRLKDADPHMREVLRLFSLKHPAFYRQVLHAGKNIETLLPIHRIAVPTLHIHGDADSTLPLKSARHLTAHIPGARLEVIAGGEHDIAYTHAGEVLSLIEQDYLSGKPLAL